MRSEVRISRRRRHERSDVTGIRSSKPDCRFAFASTGDHRWRSCLFERQICSRDVLTITAFRFMIDIKYIFIIDLQLPWFHAFTRKRQNFLFFSQYSPLSRGCGLDLRKGRGGHGLLH